MNNNKLEELHEKVVEAHREYTFIRQLVKESTASLEMMDDHIDSLIVEHQKHLRKLMDLDTLIQSKKRQREIAYLTHQDLMLSKESALQEYERVRQRLDD